MKKTILISIFIAISSAIQVCHGGDYYNCPDGSNCELLLGIDTNIVFVTVNSDQYMVPAFLDECAEGHVVFDNLTTGQRAYVRIPEETPGAKNISTILNLQNSFSQIKVTASNATGCIRWHSYSAHQTTGGTTNLVCPGGGTCTPLLPNPTNRLDVYVYVTQHVASATISECAEGHVIFANLTSGQTIIQPVPAGSSITSPVSATLDLPGDASSILITASNQAGCIRYSSYTVYRSIDGVPPTPCPGGGFCDPVLSANTNDVEVFVYTEQYVASVQLAECAEGHVVFANLTSGQILFEPVPASTPTGSVAFATLAIPDQTSLIQITASNQAGCIFSYVHPVFRVKPEELDLNLISESQGLGSVSDTTVVSGQASGTYHGFIVLSNLANLANHHLQFVPATNTWVSTAIPLSYGDNLISACASGLYGSVACDSITITRGGLGIPDFEFTDSATNVVPWRVYASINGSNNLHVAGNMVVENTRTGERQVFVAPTSHPFNWTTPGMYLEDGTNVLIITATNILGDIVERRTAINRNAGTTRYVDDDSGYALPPYTNWTTAASNIQDAVNYCQNGDVVLVNDGLYNRGETLNYLNHFRVSITNNITLKSVNGAAHTIIEGSGPAFTTTAVAGLFNAGESEIIGFTIRKGHPRRLHFPRSNNNGGVHLGGGVLRESVINGCYPLALVGLGANGLVYDTKICGNTGTYNVVYVARLDRCQIEDNVVTNTSAAHLGVCYNALINNTVFLRNKSLLLVNGLVQHSIFIDNIRSNNLPLFDNSTVAGSVILNNVGGMPTYSILSNNLINNPGWDSIPGNMSGDPLFIDQDIGDYRLQTNSPLIDTALAYITADNPLVNAILNSMAALDYERVGRPLDGNSDGVAIADIGIHEFVAPGVDSDGDGITDEYEVETFGSNPANADSDRDLYSDGDELIAGTNPRDFGSRLQFFEFSTESDDEGQRVVLRWPSIIGRVYSIYKKDNMMSEFIPVPAVQNAPGTGELMVYADTEGLPWNFYQIRVERE